MKEAGPEEPTSEDMPTVAAQHIFRQRYRSLCAELRIPSWPYHICILRTGDVEQIEK